MMLFNHFTFTNAFWVSPTIIA